jgi:hypothetical protein
MRAGMHKVDCEGVRGTLRITFPTLSALLMFAPRSNSSFTTALWQPLAAASSAVRPFCTNACVGGNSDSYAQKELRLKVSPGPQY